MSKSSRLKRWLFQNKREVDLNGDLRLDYAQGMRSRGMSQEAIDDLAARMKARYEELKQLDETDPEPWLEYTAYDFFTNEDKQRFLPDGSLKPEYVANEIRLGISMNYLSELQRRKRQEVANFQIISEQYAEQGMNYGEYLASSIISQSKVSAGNRQYLRQDILNGEDISELSVSIDPDDYYERVGT